MARFGMAIDTRVCVGCMDCVAACKTENEVPEGLTRDWVAYDARGLFPHVQLEIRSERCNHCDNPPCVAACPTGASHVEPFGKIVLVEADECIGCKACIAACPYDARFVNPNGYADKCTFCVRRVRQALDPACATVCPARAIHFGDLDDPASQVSQLVASRRNHALLEEAGTGPRIFYLE